METTKTVKIEMTGNGLYEHIATASDGRSIARRGSCFECVNKDGYLTFDRNYALDSACEEFNK